MCPQRKYGYTFQYVVGVKNPEDITGGYLVELDNAYYASEHCWFKTSVGTFVVKDPDNLSYEMMVYISEFFQEAVNNSGSSGTKASTYIDAESFAEVYIVEQFVQDADWTALSSYFYLPSYADAGDGYSHVIYAGPAWDFDKAFGVRTDGDAASVNSTSGLLYGTFWYTSNPVVKAKVSQLASKANSLVSSLAAQVSSTATRISASQAMNEILWGLTSFNNVVDPYPTYKENLNYLISWITARASWLSKNGWI